MVVVIPCHIAPTRCHSRIACLASVKSANMVMATVRLASLSSLVCCQEKTEQRGIVRSTACHAEVRVLSNVKVSTLTSHQILSSESFFTVMAEVIEADLSSHTIYTQSSEKVERSLEWRGRCHPFDQRMLRRGRHKASNYTRTVSRNRTGVTASYSS